MEKCETSILGKENKIWEFVGVKCQLLSPRFWMIVKFGLKVRFSMIKPNRAYPSQKLESLSYSQETSHTQTRAYNVTFTKSEDTASPLNLVPSF